MDAPDKALDAAARAWHEKHFTSRWEDASPWNRPAILSTVVPLVDAATPYIAAQALRDAANEMMPPQTHDTPWTVQQFGEFTLCCKLLAKADEIDPR